MESYNEIKDQTKVIDKEKVNFIFKYFKHET